MSNDLRLADRIAIQDVLGRWTRLLDRADWDHMLDVFHPDAIDEHGLFRGSVDEVRTWLEVRAPAIEQSFHQLGQVVIDFIGERSAVVETYVIAWFRYASRPDRIPATYLAEHLATCGLPVTVVMPGRYIDRFERRDSGWRIAQRHTIFEAGTAWAEGGKVAFDAPILRSRRDKAVVEQPAEVRRGNPSRAA